MEEGMRIRSVLGWMVCAFLGASLLMAHVWRQNAYVRWSRELFVVERHIDQVRNDLALLETEIDFLSRRSRLETIARDKLGLTETVSPIPVYAGDGAPLAIHAMSHRRDLKSEAGQTVSHKVESAPRSAKIRLGGFASELFGRGETP
jgi:hypothetical protein